MGIDNVISILGAIVSSAAAVFAAVFSARHSRSLETLRSELAKDADERAFGYAKAKALHERQMDVARDLWVAAATLRAAASRAIGAPVAVGGEEVQAEWAKALGELQAADAVFQAASRSAAPFLPEVRSVADELSQQLDQAFRADQDRRLNATEALSASSVDEKRDAQREARGSRERAQANLQRSADQLELLLATLQRVVGSSASPLPRSALPNSVAPPQLPQGKSS